MSNRKGYTYLYFSVVPLIIILSVILGTGYTLYLIRSTINKEIYDNPRGTIGQETPEDWGLSYREIEFKSEGELTIRGWFVDHPHTNKVIIVAPGRGTSRWDVLKSAPKLYKGGYDVLLFDPQNTGLSEGEKYGFGYYESKDIIYAIDYLKKNYQVEQIGVIGVSSGAVAALIATLECEDIKAVVADSPYANLRLAATTYGEHSRDILLEPLFPVYMMVASLSLGVDIYYQTNLLERITQLDTPVFFIHGLEDNALAPINSEKLYQRVKAPKEIWLPQGVGHANAVEIYPEQYTGRVLQFFDRYLTDNPTSN